MRNVLKICSVAVLALVLVMAMFTSAFAAGSATEPVEFWDGTTKVSETQDPPADAELTNADAKTLAETEDDLTNLWYGNVTSDNLSLTCKIENAESGTTYYVFHYDGVDKAWEYVGKGTGAEFGVTFFSLSPVAVFKSTEAGSSDVPKTGDSNNMMLWGGLMVAAAAAAVGTVIYSKKRRTEA